MRVGVAWYMLRKPGEHLLGLVEGLLIAVRWAIAPGTFFGNPGVFQSLSIITLGESHLG